MECKKCGNVLPENAKFCFECGAKVEQELVCVTCGAKMSVGYKFCMECGNVLAGSGKMADDLEELRNNIKIMIQDYIKNNKDRDTVGIFKWKYIEVQENVIWTGYRLIDLRELSTIEEMKTHIGKDLNSEMVDFWHLCWPKWEMYCRELDYQTSWISRVYGNEFYYITGNGKEATLHKDTIGIESKKEIQTWSEVQIFEDKEKNVRILAHNLQEGGCHSKEWILLNDFGEKLWEEENATALRVRAKGWCLDYWPSEDMYNFSMLLDFYTGNVLLKGYCDYTYYINDKTGEIIIAADRIGDNDRISVTLYLCKNGEAIRFKDEEIKRYGIKQRTDSLYKVEIPQFKEMECKLRETYELLT